MKWTHLSVDRHHLRWDCQNDLVAPEVREGGDEGEWEGAATLPVNVKTSLWTARDVPRRGGQSGTVVRPLNSLAEYLNFGLFVMERERGLRGMNGQSAKESSCDEGWIFHVFGEQGAVADC